MKYLSKAAVTYEKIDFSPSEFEKKNPYCAEAQK